MSEATCKTCPWWNDGSPGQCRKRTPATWRESTMTERQLGEHHHVRIWPPTYQDDWCGEHPERQPHLECATATIVSGETFPTAADMRRIIDALEKMASRAARVKP